MYIQKAEIKNIRSIIDFEIEFKNPAGWHVLIGDNGAGKSSIIQSISLALVGNKEVLGLRINTSEWINLFASVGEIWLELLGNKNLDVTAEHNIDFGKTQVFTSDVVFSKMGEDLIDLENREKKRINNTILWQIKSGFFSVAYGPYRRFEGGNFEWSELFKNKSFSRLAAHLSAFGEDVALTEALIWLKDLNYKSLEQDKESQYTLKNLQKLINSEDFLPHNTQLESVSSDGVFFKDGNGTIISVNQMSDGYRSILSMTFELIRQLVRVYGSELVFKNIEKGEMFIDLPGVVLVDEIDAHLHPTWQTRIGQWFLKYFPQLQFIVTTHSPLVCRAAEKGSIWRLAAPGSDEKSGEIIGLDRERLIYGNVLDAYGTEVFGENVSISQDSNEMLNRLSELNVKSMMGLIEDKENSELQKLRAKFPTENKVSIASPPKVMKARASAGKGMAQTEIVGELAEKVGIKKTDVKGMFDALAALAASEVKKNGEFTLPGFGKLVKATRKAREGRNPAIGNSIKIPAKTTVIFRLGKAMKDSIE